MYPASKFKLGYFEKTFQLKKGEKEIKILFPSLVASSVASIEIDDGASFKPVKKSGVYLAIGDSITQGYDALFPRHRYTNLVAERFGLYEHNLAIGGEKFRPDLGECVHHIKPSLVTVAYGSNDWFAYTYEQTRNNCERFFEHLTGNLPNQKIFVISPIWRKDYQTKTAFGDFKNVHQMLADVCGKHKNLMLINGYDFVPHNEKLFGDGSLHPNDKGFEFYAERLLKNLQ